MIEELLTAINDSGVDAGPDELADILWLAARIDPAPLSTAENEPDGGKHTEQPAPLGQPPQTPEESEPGTRLFSASDRKGLSGSNGQRGVSVRVHRAASLDDPLAVMRSLRPMGRRTVIGVTRGTKLDEEETVARSAEQLMLSPVLRPAHDRWLDLALVVDTHHSMLLWDDLVNELCRTISQTGVFRDVRVWFLQDTQVGGVPAVTHTRSGAPRSPQEITDPSGHRLILVVTDAVAGGWNAPELETVMRHWCEHNSVAVLNLLPERLWSRGSVRPSPLLVRTATPAAPNASLKYASAA